MKDVTKRCVFDPRHEEARQSLRHKDLLAQVHAVTAQSYAMGAEWLRTIVDKDELPMPAEQMVRVIHALSEGLVLQTLLMPDLFPKSLYYAAFDALAFGSKRAKGK